MTAVLRTARAMGAMALACLALAAPLRAGAQVALPQSTPAEAAIVVDLSSGAVLLEKNADKRLPPASMSKLMTLDVVFEALEAGLLELDTRFAISARAAGMGGSKMFIREGERVSIENLIRGVTVQSGNDAAVALAEALSGTEEAFAEALNQRARALGLDNSHFVNSTGWPHPEQYMSVRDLATIAARIITEFPEYYGYFSQRQFTWDDITQSNRNPLLDLGLGVDGLKTGHTQAAGYGLVASAERDGRRVVMVIAGLESASQRAQEGERLIDWAFRAFETRKLYSAGEPLVEVPVWIGERGAVPAVAARDVVVTVPFGLPSALEIRATYDAPVAAPVEKGAPLGHLTLEVEGMADVTVPLEAAEAVGRGGFLARIEAAAQLILDRLLPAAAG